MAIIIDSIERRRRSTIYAIIENGARNADGSCGAYKFPIQEGCLLSMMAYYTFSIIHDALIVAPVRLS